MLKVFLVEDEFVVREGIKNNVDWKGHGYDFCGEASDGELAYSMIQKLKPDIVITDIRMPFMDGLVLSRLIKKEMPQIEIIVLSGYEEFEYAKEAIKIGIAQYLCKPINGEELLAEVDAVALKIEEKRKERAIKELYMREMEENTRKERKDFFQHLVTGTKSVAELLEQAGKLRIDISSVWYNIVLIKLKSENHALDEYSNSLVEIEEKLRDIQERMGIINFDRNLEGTALLFKADSIEELLKLQSTYLEEMKNILNTYQHVWYFGGIGQPVNRLLELPNSFARASHAFAHQYLISESVILDSRDMEKSAADNKDDFDLGNVSPKSLDRAKIRDFLKLGDQEETVYFVEEFFRALGDGAVKSAVFRQYIVMDSYFCVVEFLEELQLSRGEIEPLDLNSSVFQNEEDAYNYIVRIIQNAVVLRERAASNRYGKVVREVTDYIEQNYADEELSLNLLASHVNFSPNHLSMIFSQQTGQTFIKYLTDYRMNKAKELLRCTNKKSSEVSFEVGYKDPHYFSYLFKKTQGMTPTQYRVGKGAE